MELLCSAFRKGHLTLNVEILHQLSDKPGYTRADPSRQRQEIHWTDLTNVRAQDVNKVWQSSDPDLE